MSAGRVSVNREGRRPRADFWTAIGTQPRAVPRLQEIMYITSQVVTIVTTRLVQSQPFSCASLIASRRVRA